MPSEPWLEEASVLGQETSAALVGAIGLLRCLCKGAIKPVISIWGAYLCFR
jgi:hypothetical protein